ncbi:MAG TPA: AAA family ATPase, partial [Nitrosospira sp.]|nr:AAA family ATPase [Nitrosospira sp.]
MQTNYLEFHPFRLDKTNAILWCDDQVVRLRPKSFAMLCYLAERSGTLVTKDELLDAVWQRRCVGEAVLKVCINELRRALGDNVSTPNYLLTVPRRGYRFIAPVTDVKSPEKAEKTAFAVLSKNQLPDYAAYWIDRAQPQARLLAIWQKSLKGSRQVVFVTGEGGIGKTTLIEMFLSAISSQSPGVLRMRCIERFGQGEALLPMIEAIEKRCSAPDGKKLIDLLYRHAPVWLAQLPSVLQPEERVALQQEIFGASRERMVREGCELLETLSKVPLVLVLEDLHWSDHATLDFLSLLAQRHMTARLMVLATYRPLDASQQVHPVTGVHRDLQLKLREVCSEVALEPFSLDEAKHYLTRRFPGIDIPDSISQSLFIRTGGHPLFISNLIEYLINQYQWSPSSHKIVVDTALPETIRRVIEREIERLSPEEQRVLTAASVAGMQFRVSLLCAVLGMEITEVDRCCNTLVRRGQILVSNGMEQSAKGGVAGHYAFRHALYLEVLYQRLSPAEAIRMHLRIGECLEELYGEQNVEHAGELALHFENGWDWLRTIRYLIQAADNSTRRFANRQAHDYLVHAFRVIERLPTEQQAKTSMSLLKQSAAVRRSMGDMAGAKTDLEKMLAVARTLGNSREQVVGLLELSRVLVLLNRLECLEFAEQAVSACVTLEDKVLQAIVKGMWGGLNLLLRPWREDYSVACHESMEAVRATGNPLALHSRLTQHIYVELLASNYQSAATTAVEALALSRLMGDGYMFIAGHYYYGLVLLHSGEWGRLRETAEQSRRAFEWHDGGLLLRVHRHILMGWLHVAGGDFSGAKAYCEEALSEGVGAWADFVSVHCSAILGKALHGLKDYAGAIRCFDAFFQAEKNKALP